MYHTRDGVDDGFLGRCRLWAVAGPLAVRGEKRSTTSWSTDKTACERRGQPSRRSIFSIVHFYFLSSPPSDAAHIPRVVHSLALLTGAEARIRIPASRRTSTRRAFPLPARSARHVALSLPPSPRPAAPPAFAFRHALHRAHHIRTRFGVPNVLRGRSAQLPHPLPAHRVSSRATAHA